MKRSAITPAVQSINTTFDRADTLRNVTLERLLRPLVRICLAVGVTIPSVEEAVKRAFVHEADALEPDAPVYGTISRISTATGLQRREVTRLTTTEKSAQSAKPALTSKLFTRWVSNPALRDDSGMPLTLKRQGLAPSFEALAQSVTRDIHPRRMLDELLRLGVVELDEDTDRVRLITNNYIPSSDSSQIYALMGDNVGDHLSAAVDNVLNDNHRHLELAVFADELSVESVNALRPLVTAHWKALRDDMVRQIEALIEADRLAGRPQDQRVRIGMYTYADKS